MRSPVFSATALLLLASPPVRTIPALPRPSRPPGRRRGAAFASKHLAARGVQTILSLTGLTDMPEGIALNDPGDIFLGDRRLLAGGEHRRGDILRITPNGQVSRYASLGLSGPDFNAGLAGLAVDAGGDVYAAFISHDPATHGVWRIDRHGGKTRLAGSAAMLLPDALAFDARGKLYVSDAEDGTLWRFPPAGSGALWVRDPLLAPRGSGSVPTASRSSRRRLCTSPTRSRT